MKEKIRTGGNLRTTRSVPYKKPHITQPLYAQWSTNQNNNTGARHFRGDRIFLQYGRGVSRSVDYDDNITSNAGVKLIWIWTTIWGQNELGWAKKYTNPELY